MKCTCPNPHDKPGVTYIPGIRYHRPNARREEGHFELPTVDNLQAKFNEIDEAHIEITAELMVGNVVNVCFDNGDFDYKFFLWGNDPELVEGLTKAILEFDADDYAKACEANAIRDEEGM